MALLKLNKVSLAYGHIPLLSNASFQLEKTERVCLLGRNGAGPSIEMRALLVGNLLFHSIDSFLTGKAALLGVMNGAGYMFSSMHFLFALGFLFYIRKFHQAS